MYRNRLFTLAVIASSIAASPAAAGQDGFVTERTRISFADLDLSNPAGVERLDKRIARAVRKSCGSDGGSDLREHREVRVCRAAAMSGVQPQRTKAIAAAKMPAIELASQR